jgi:cytochrome b
VQLKVLKFTIYARLSHLFCIMRGQLQMLVWDFPLRLFHWGLAAAVAGAIVSAKADVLWLHERFGLAVMGLVGFRVCWGFMGGYYARFKQFLVSPNAAIASMRGLFHADDGLAAAGHSAHGGYAVLGLIAIAGFMSLSGSFANDDVLFEGPLAHLLPWFSDAATNAHHIGEKLLFLMLFLHLTAILFYKFIKRRDLTMVMLRGRAVQKARLAGPDGGISVARCWAGLLLIVMFLAAAQSISLLRSVLF